MPPTDFMPKSFPLAVMPCYIDKLNKNLKRVIPVIDLIIGERPIPNNDDILSISNTGKYMKVLADQHLRNFIFSVKVYSTKYRIDKIYLWYRADRRTFKILRIPYGYSPLLPFYFKNRLTLLMYNTKKTFNNLYKLMLLLYDVNTDKIRLYRLFYFKEEVKEIFPSPDGKFLSVVTNINCAPQDKIKDHDGEIALNIDCIKDVKEPKKFFTTKKVNTLVFCSQESSGTERKQIQTLWLIKLDTKRRISITDNIYTKHSHIIDYKYKKLEKEGEYGYRYINKCKRYFDNLAWIAGNTFLPSDIEKVIWNSNSKEFLFSIRPVFEKDTLLWFYFKEEDNIDRYFRGKGRLDKLYFPEDIYKVYLGIVEKDSSVKVSVEGFYRDNLIYRVYTDVCTVAGKYEPAVVMGTGKSVGSIIDGLCNACRRGWSCYKEDRRMPISSWLLFVPKGLALQKSSMK